MKIAFLIRTLNLGGAQRQLVTLAKGLKARGHEIQIIVFYANGIFEKELRAAGIRVEVLHRQGRWDIISIWRQLATIIRKENPQVIHGYLETPNVLAAFLKIKAPNAKIIFGLRASQIEYENYDWAIRVMNRVEARAATFADLIIANSRAGVATAIKSGFPKEKLIVIQNGIDTEKFSPNVESRMQRRKDLGIRENDILIGFVGRIDPKKDHATFLRAAAIIRQKYSDVHFVCVGGNRNDSRQHLERMSCDLKLSDCFHWLDSQTEMAAVYNAMDIFCSASAFGEGFSNVIGEAMACGVPCVATDVGDAAEIVGPTGIIVPPKNPEELAAGIIKIFSAELTGLRLAARSRMIEKFGVDKLINNTEAKLLSLN